MTAELRSTESLESLRAAYDAAEVQEKRAFGVYHRARNARAPTARLDELYADVLAALKATTAAWRAWRSDLDAEHEARKSVEGRHITS